MNGEGFMRAKEKVFNDFLKNMNENEFLKIKTLLENSGDNKFFLGVREDYLSIYYMGMSIATVRVLKNGGCSYTLSYYYLKGVKDKNGVCKYDGKTKGYYTVSSAIFWDEDNFKTILYNVRHHVLGFGARGYIYLEKACQQWIINANNSNPKSDWYYIDMEYIYKKDGEKSEHPFGRADIIAIKKSPENGIHKVAFVELKVGTGAYGVSIKVPSNITDKNDKDTYRKNVVKNLQKNLWDEKNVGVKLGSGLASHVVDFMQYFAEEEAALQLREEIVGIIDVHKKFGLIDESNSLYYINSGKKLSSTTDICIVTYSEAPDISREMLSKKAQERYSVQSLNDMKMDFYKYFFKGKGSSSLSIEKLINNADISGLIEMKKSYMEFMNTKEIEIECNQDIKKVSYRFVFRFIDMSDKKIDPTKCI